MFNLQAYIYLLLILVPCTIEIIQMQVNIPVPWILWELMLHLSRSIPKQTASYKCHPPATLVEHQSTHKKQNHAQNYPFYLLFTSKNPRVFQGAMSVFQWSAYFLRIWSYQTPNKCELKIGTAEFDSSVSYWTMFIVGYLLLGVSVLWNIMCYPPQTNTTYNWVLEDVERWHFSFRMASLQVPS